MKFIHWMLVLAVAQGAVQTNANAATKKIKADTPAALKIGVDLIDDETRDFLKSFQTNSQATIQKKPLKFNRTGTALVLNQKTQFLAGDNKTSYGLKLSDKFRKGQVEQLKRVCQGPVGGPECLSGADGRRGVLANDQAENLTENGRDGSFVNNIFDMANITEGKVDVQPWSSYYWAIASGITAYRYSSSTSDFPSMDWHGIDAYYKKWFLEHGADAVDYIETLSPAEKYDLLVGDSNWTLTTAQIKEGKQYAFDERGQPQEVASWMGICHGWAPASYMEPRARHEVSALSPSGIQITFRPDDIKALASLKWAYGQAVHNENGRLTHATRFIGGRCNIKSDEIQRDASGAITNKDCFDSNPASWHKSIVNQIGLTKKSFVMDATFDYEVWNQPVVSYSYTYFNPATLQPVETLQEAIQPIGFSGDKFASRRKENYSGQKPQSVVGVIMQVTYLVETMPNDKSRDSESDDALNTVRYVYDLEIANDGRILGGEWYQDAHPDFLWTDASDSYAWVDTDEYFTNVNYSIDQPVPDKVKRFAPQASKQNAPLKIVLDALLAASSTN